MDCKEICELLTAYLDGEVTPQEKVYIEAHLPDCPRCRAELEALSAAQINLRGVLRLMADEVSPSPQIWENIRKRLEGKELAARSRFLRWRGLSIASLWHRPGWKTALLSVLGLTAIIGFSLSTINIQSPEAMAASIAHSSPEVQSALNGEEMEEIEVVTKIVDGEGNVLLVLVQTETRAVTAMVDIKTKRMTEIIRVHVPEFTSQDEQRARDIATANPGIQELLAQGGIISRVSPSYDLSYFREGEVKMGATISVELGGKRWSAIVDLEKGIVYGPWMPPPLLSLSSVSMSHLFYRLVALGFIILGILVLVGLTLRNRPAEAIASVASILLGIIGLFWGLYAMSSLPGALALVLGTPAIGLLIGILALRRRTGRVRATIAGVIICSLALVWDVFNIIMAFRATLEAERLFSPEAPSSLFTSEWVVPLLLTIIGVALIFLAVKYRTQLLRLFATGRIWRLATIATMVVVILAAAAIWQFGGIGQAPPAPAPTPAPAPAPSPGPISPPGVPPGPVTPPTATYSVQIDFVPSQTVYMPGDEVEIEVRLTNESVEPVTVTRMPPKLSLVLLESGEDNVKVIHTFNAGTEERELAVGGTAIYTLTWDQKDENGNQSPPGWYFGEFEYTVRPQTAPENEWRSGGRNRLFLVQYPQGAMEKIIDLDLSQAANGLPLEVDNKITPVDIVLTLKRVELTEEGASFFVLLTSPNNPLPSYDEVWWHIALDEHAKYVFDGTVKDARGANTKYTEDGIELRWGREGNYRDPIPSDTKELTFIITRLGDDWDGPWEFTVPLK